MLKDLLLVWLDSIESMAGDILVGMRADVFIGRKLILFNFYDYVFICEFFLENKLEKTKNSSLVKLSNVILQNFPIYLLDLKDNYRFPHESNIFLNLDFVSCI